MVPYRAMLDVPYEVVEHVSWLIYARRRELHSRWRRLSCFRQALLVLVHLRKNETLAQVGAGFGVSTATAGRYVSEAVDVLAELAPGLMDALQGHDPNEFLILDGTLVRTDRVAADEPYYSQKHRYHGMNVAVLARPDGTPIWYRGPCPAAPTTSPRPVPTELSKPVFPGRSWSWLTAPTGVPAPPSAPRTTDAICRKSTLSSTETTPGYERRANAPSPGSSSGGSSGRPAAAPTESAEPSPPFTRSRSPGEQDEKRSVT